MSITITDHEPQVTLTKRELRMIFNALDGAYSEIEAAVADGDVKEEVQTEMEEALKIIQRYLR